MIDWYKMPLGLGVAFSENPEAKQRFLAMSEQERDGVIAKAGAIKSREGMSAYVRSLVR
ncbi:MAG: hypothetical protein GX647_09290 [Clostridiales bacterium]|jgi:uncharacterized protein YdeI (YjbR/CyaY-like superfamily)|nr:hypothetical protein [Clostridiales bacterium]